MPETMPPFSKSAWRYEFKAMSVTLFDAVHTIGSRGLGIRLQFAGIQPESHRATHIRDGTLIDHQVNDGVFCATIEFR
jgi:hypothetical protein